MATACDNKPQSRPILLLKDYLRDDLSSCSSSGFKSLPRRQCYCLHRRSSSSCSTKSALQKASEVVLNVIKSLQIPVPHKSSPSSLSKTFCIKKGVLSRSFSRRLLRRNFWRRASSSSSKGDSNKPCTFVNSTASSASAAANSSDNSTLVETSFTCSDSTDIEASVTAAAAATNSCSVTNSTREWANEEKEQFSPVSVLDCLLFDDDEEITSPFNSTPACSTLEEGSKHKHMQQKSQRFNLVASLNSVTLEKRISWSELNNNNYLLCDNVEEKARDLLNHIKRSIPSSCLTIEEENMLFDFFKQSIGDIINNNDDVDNLIKQNLCKVAEDWIRGQQHQEQYLSSWESWEGREVYIKEMNKYCRSWRNSDDKETESVAMNLEVYFFTSLVNELLLELTT